MPIKSYLAMPYKGQKNALKKTITAFPECEVMASENKDVLVLLTETSDEGADKKLFHKINSLENLQLLTLVSAFSENTESTQK